AAGGGISAASKSKSGNQMGSHLFLAGLILQLVSFALYTTIYGIFLYRVRTKNPEIWHCDRNKPWYNDWRTLSNVLCVSCVGILIRSFYRVVELSQGYQGYLATTEAYFYALDTLPLFIAISIFTPFWPGRFIDSNNPMKGRYQYHPQMELQPKE
ncbi:hypothetical protein H0H93_016678, partial [Arthromyces matolae]